MNARARQFLAVIAALVLIGCQKNSTYQPHPALDAKVQALMDEFNAATVGAGIIRNGELVWTGFYGEESPGVPASHRSVFNTASMNKSVTAELAIRLQSVGLIDLDAPISEFYVHPDIKDDPRHQLLTPRVLLTHQAGFLNWPFLYDDEKLAFIDQPGNGNYYYSGIGVRIFAKFVENKLNQSFPDIVREQILVPLDMGHTTNSHDIAKNFAHIVRPVDSDGQFAKETPFETDYWSAADDLFTTVDDYAAFLIATMNNTRVDEASALLRAQLQTDLTNNEIWGCDQVDLSPCPAPYGHSVGWFVFGYDGELVVHHGGNDVSEGAIGYFDPKTRHGGIVFINGPQGLQMWPKVVALIDPKQRVTPVFEALIAQYFPNE